MVDGCLIRKICDKINPHCRKLILGVLLTGVLSSSLEAGPPFRTDDPEPVEHHHWEFYIASAQQFTHSEVDASLPHFEVNYGLVPNVQVHVLAPMGYFRDNNGSHYGYSDSEIGVKYRFVQESETLPQVGTFPLVELPTGSKANNLGSGTAQLFIPLWLQKSWGKFTTYGGGGVWYNRSEGGQNWTYIGWLAQYDLSETMTLGGEAFYHTADTQDGNAGSGFNLGGFVNVNEHNHLLFSVGHSIHGDNITTGYIGYQMTL